MNLAPISHCEWEKGDGGDVDCFLFKFLQGNETIPNFWNIITLQWNSSLPPGLSYSRMQHSLLKKDKLIGMLMNWNYQSTSFTLWESENSSCFLAHLSFTAGMFALLKLNKHVYTVEFEISVNSLQTRWGWFPKVSSNQTHISAVKDKGNVFLFTPLHPHSSSSLLQTHSSTLTPQNTLLILTLPNSILILTSPPSLLIISPPSSLPQTHSL